MPNENGAFRLEGRRALVVGDGESLGQAIEAQLAAAGARVARQAVEAALATPAAQLSPIDILVINVAETPSARSTSRDEWGTIQQLNEAFVEGPARLAAAYLPHMERQRWGRIIHIAGVSEHSDASSRAAVAAARSAQSVLLQSEARRLAPLGVTMNLIVSLGRGAEERDAAANSCYPAIASAVLYFAGEGASFVTGQSLVLGDERNGRFPASAASGGPVGNEPL